MDPMIKNTDSARKAVSNKLMICGVTENNGGVWWKKVMSKKNQGLQHSRGKRRK